MNQRKITSIIVVLVLATGLGLLLYFIFTAPQRPGERRPFFGNLPLIGQRSPLGGEPTPQPSLPAPPPEREHPIQEIVDKAALAPTLSADGKSLLYILRENGRVLSSDFDGDNETELTTLTLLETFDAVWSPKKDRVAVFYHENGAVKKLLLGVASGTPSKFLPQEVTSLDWSPDGRSIAYLLKRNSDTALVTADVANKTPRTVYTTLVPDFTLRWISKNTILLISRPSGLAPSLVLEFNLSTERTTVLLSNRNGIIALPLPDASGLLLSQSSPSGKAETLKTYQFKTAATNELNQITLAEKCAFALDAKKLYCGVPRGTLASPMPDEWYKGMVSFTDTVLTINLATNQIEDLTEDNVEVDIVSPLVSPDGKYLFFLDKKTSALWRLIVSK